MLDCANAYRLQTFVVGSESLAGEEAEFATKNGLPNRMGSPFKE